jgi:hypothetical protein
MGFKVMGNASTDLFAIIPVSSSRDANAKEAICIGPMKEVFAYLPQTAARDQAEAELARVPVTADQIKRMQSATTAMQVAAFADAIDHLERRLDAKEAELEEQARRDAEEAERREAERIAAHMRALPDADDPSTWDPAPAGGALTPLPASHSEDKEQLAASDQGDLPNELLEGAPADPGTAPTIGLDVPRVPSRQTKRAPMLHPQPIAVSLNED